MSIYYCDTSALVKLYIPESGSQWMKQIVLAQNQEGYPQNVLNIVQIGIVEAAAAVARHERMGSLTTERRKRLYRLILRDSKSKFQIFAITETLIYLAAALTQGHPLRGYDAVHLAAALELNKHLTANQLPPITFVSADEKLCQAAAGEGLQTENPNYR